MSLRVVIAGGGTGGHVFPGIAVADALKAAANAEVTFVGTSRGLESRLVPARGYPLELLHVEPMKGGGPARVVRGGATAARATFSGYDLARRLKPDVVISVGGYAAGPLSLAACARGVPLVLIEPNATMGLANRMLTPFAKRVYVAWDDLAASVGGRARKFGVPLRSGFVPTETRKNGAKRLLILGGSQGAAPLNDRLPHAVAAAQKAIPDLTVLHQTGRDREERVTAAYAALHLDKSVRVVPFLDDLVSELTEADVVVARSGALTVAEIAAVGRASILVPYPQAADDHQHVNAKALAKVGGAVCIRQEAADDVRLASEIVHLFRDDAARVAMAEAARNAGKSDAASRIAADVIEIADRASSRSSRGFCPSFFARGAS